MNKKELITQVAYKTGYPTREVTQIVGAVFDTIAERIIHGATVSIQEFGKFTLKHCKPRRARNFASGEYYMMDAYTDVKFDVADAVYNELNPKKK